MNNEEAKRRGRPRKPPAERRETVTFRLLPAVVAKARRLGNERLEALIARAKEPA